VSSSPWSALRNWSAVAGASAFWWIPDMIVGPFDRGHRVVPYIMHRWARSMADVLGIHRELRGAENLANTGQCVMVANHQSLLDILVIGSFVTRDFRWLAKASLYWTPVVGWHLTLAGHLKVYRGKQRHRNRDLAQRIHQAVTEGASLLWFPEGTRSPDGRLQPFRMGAFTCAVDEDLPVLPLVLRGTGQLLRKGSIDLAVDAHRTCSVTVLPAVAPPRDGDPATRAERLRDQVFEAIRRAYEQGAGPAGAREERETP